MMAGKGSSTDNTGNTDKPGKARKRRVKDPETFRERVLKAGEEAKKGKSRRPSRPRKAGALAATAAKPIKRAGRTKPARIAGKVVFPAYFRNSLKELKLVTWLDWKKSRELTFAVLVFAIIFGAIVSVVDYGLNSVFKSILLK